MAQTLENALNVKKKALGDTRTAASQALLRTLFSYLAQHKPGVDLQFVAISGLDTADVVLSDVAGRLYCVLLRKPAASTTNAWAKISNHATTAAANGENTYFLVGTGGGGQEICECHPNGQIFTTGMTIGSHTANNGNTKSNIADAPVGFGIVGA